jgi:hypothetical protein
LQAKEDAAFREPSPHKALRFFDSLNKSEKISDYLSARTAPRKIDRTPRRNWSIKQLAFQIGPGISARAAVRKFVDLRVELEYCPLLKTTWLAYPSLGAKDIHSRPAFHQTPTLSLLSQRPAKEID